MNKLLRNTLIGSLVIIGAFAIPVGLQLGKVGYDEEVTILPYEDIEYTREYVEEEYKDTTLTFAEAFLVEFNDAFTYVEEELVIDTTGTDYTVDTTLDEEDGHVYEYTIIDLRNGEKDTEVVDYSFHNSVILMDPEDTIWLTGDHREEGEGITYTVQAGGTINFTSYIVSDTNPITNSILDAEIPFAGSHLVFEDNLELEITFDEMWLVDDVEFVESWFTYEGNLYNEVAIGSSLQIEHSYIIPELE